MGRQRRLLLGLGIVLALVALVYVVALASDDDGSSEATSTDADETTTTEASTTTTSSVTTPSTTTTVAPTSTTVPPTTTTAASAPPFRSSIETVTLADLGSSWKPGLGCPGPDGLRAVNVSHWGYDGAVRQGRIVVAASQADRVVAVFGDLYAARFPIQRMVPIDAYGGDDQASMRDNNTSGFNCRYVAGTTKLSQHGLGLAIDVNPLVNPYVKGGTVDPPEGAPWADRSRDDPGMIHAGDAAVQAFARQGWGWGGSWSGGKDYQHFSRSGT